MAPDTLTSDFWLRDWERMRFCGLKPPGRCCFVIGNKTGARPSTKSLGPRRKPPDVMRRYSPLVGQTPRHLRGPKLCPP